MNRMTNDVVVFYQLSLKFKGFSVMIVNSNRDIKLIAAQFGAALAVSFAGFLFSRLRNKRRIRPSLPPLKNQPSDHDSESEDESRRGVGRRGRDPHTIAPKGDKTKQKTSQDRDVFLSPEFQEIVEENDIPVCRVADSSISKSSIPLAFPSEEESFDYEEEIQQLRNTVKILREKENDLEAKLVEYCSLKEQQKVAKELRNRLKLNQMESKLLNLKIESLQSENQRLGDQLADHGRIVLELEAARSQIQLLKEKLRSAAEQNKEQILSLQERVTKLYEEKSADPDTEKSMQRLKDLEVEVMELKESNARLRLENSDLAERLEFTQILANAKLEVPEMEALKEEQNQLKHENEDMRREIEQLQAGRCSDIEELVYLKWINACLRYELRNYQPPDGKAIARDLNKSLSHRSEKKAKELILEYAHREVLSEEKMNSECDRWSSSQESFVTESGDPGESPVETNMIQKPVQRNHLLGKSKETMQVKDYQDYKFEGHRFKSSSSMDFQAMMRRGKDFSRNKSGLSDQEDMNKELVKYAEALNSRAVPKKVNRRSASYCFGDTM